jgi:hypothetical protein
MTAAATPWLCSWLLLSPPEIPSSSWIVIVRHVDALLLAFLIPVQMYFNAIPRANLI